MAQPGVVPARREGQLQHRDRRTTNLQPEIPPAARHAVARVVLGNIKATDEANRNIAHQHFSVIAEGKAVELERVEPADFTTRRPERLPERIGEGDRAEGIDQHAHLHPAVGRRDQVLAKCPARFIVREDVDLEVD